MKFEIKHRFNGSTVFAAEIITDENTSYGVKLGLAVKAALESKANLSKADLSKADLSKADLSWADLSKADLSWANLSKADLSKADLSKADLSGADLSKADLSKADLSKADLSGADLSKADLSKADLSKADLSWANLSKADLSWADLSKADLRYIKHDIWGILVNAIPEIPALRQALLDGKVDGSTYKGTCACLCGTIANIRHADYEHLDGISPDPSSMAEKFFLSIRKGDTPENNQPAKLVLSWIDELVELLDKAKRESR